MPKNSYKDVVVLVDGQPVCVGDMNYAAKALGITYESLRTYIYASPLEGTRVRRLAPLWLVEGHDKPVSERTAANLVGCDVSDVRRIANSKRDRRITRFRHEPWSLPFAMIDSLRKQDRRRRAASKRDSRSSAIDDKAAFSNVIACV